ncbi:hypothetical protein BSPWISOXPB_5233 [uncultured Gammaproteobacteria bacterium]|nr:hypothetical protein BSPWISOXPB_3333 [uncultured Gammaproteobacteria bacterium]VVM22812.1 hypothetical protein BSPWISOXPB_5233 [uncultured Gammaproteobacteria bacterium]
MKILNYKLDTTNELLTSRIGLITPAHTIQVLDLSKTIDQHFPALGSNCALKASAFINTLRPLHKIGMISKIQFLPNW